MQLIFEKTYLKKSVTPETFLKKIWFWFSKTERLECLSVRKFCLNLNHLSQASFMIFPFIDFIVTHMAIEEVFFFGFWRQNKPKGCVWTWSVLKSENISENTCRKRDCDFTIFFLLFAIIVKFCVISRKFELLHYFYHFWIYCAFWGLLVWWI